MDLTPGEMIGNALIFLSSKRGKKDTTIYQLVKILTGNLKTGINNSVVKYRQMNKKQQLELYQQILSIYDGGEWANKEGLAEAIKDMLLGPDYGDTFWDDEMAQHVYI